MRIQQNGHKYMCICIVESIEVWGIPGSTPKPEVGLPNWIASWQTCGVWKIREPEYTCSWLLFQ